MTEYSENAINVFKKLYFKKDSDDNLIETHPDEVFKRVAQEVANGDKGLEKSFLHLMSEGYFRPCTPCLMNVGVQENPQTAACFIGDLKDSIKSIFSFITESALIFKNGSGIGGNFGALREEDANLSTGGHSSGPCAFLRTWSSTAEDIKAGGTKRRAAELAMFFDNHPDLLKFISIKNGKDQLLKNMNISVAVSNKFMEAVKHDKEWELIGVVDGKVKSVHRARDIYDKMMENAHKTGDPGVWFIDRANIDNCLIEEYGRMTSTNPCFSGDTLIPTSEGVFPIKELVGKNITIFDGNNWVETNSFRKTGENQELLRITIIKDNQLISSLDVTPYHTMYYDDNTKVKAGHLKIGDKLLSIVEGDSIVVAIEKLEGLHDVYCCTIPTTHKILTATNVITGNCGEISGLNYYACALASINLTKFVKKDSNYFKWSKFEEVARIGTIFLDRMIEISGYPTPDYTRMAKDTRPLGLGIMGLADTLCMLKIPYNSKQGFQVAKKLTQTLTKTAIETSIELGKQYGNLKGFEKNKENILTMCERFEVPKEKVTHLRNSNWTTIAPTGSISISADCSPGMEPLFGICYTKNIADSKEKWIFVNPIFEEEFSNKPWYQDAIKKIVENGGSCQKVDCVPEEVKKVWVTAHDIGWRDRLEMQAALQMGISNSISSTVNLPSTATVEDIKDIYMVAWEKGLKGVTIYRDGSLEGQPVEFTKEQTVVEEKKITPLKRPKIRSGKVYELMTGHGKIYVTVTEDNKGNVLEIFTNGGKNGGISAANLEAIARLASLALQHGVSVEDVSRTLLRINDGTCVWDKLCEDDDRARQIVSIPDAVGQILQRFYTGNKNYASLVSSGSGILSEKEEPNNQLICPDCGCDAFMMEGCLYCHNCGSKCS